MLAEEIDRVRDEAGELQTGSVQRTDYLPRDKSKSLTPLCAGAHDEFENRPSRSYRRW